MSVTVATGADGDADSNATARATGDGATSVLPVAGLAAAAATVTPPPRTPDPVPKRRRFRRAKTEYPKLAKAPKPVKPLKPPKPKRRARKQQLGPPSPSPSPSPAPAVALAVPVKSTRTWKARHWAVILAAPLIVITGGAIAYAKLTEHAPIVAVPDVEGSDLFFAAATLHDAGFEVDGNKVTSPRPGGTIIIQRPANGEKFGAGLDRPPHRVAARAPIVPVVAGMSFEEAKAELAKQGLTNVPAPVPDYRDDVEPGTVISSNPGAYINAMKTAPVELVVAVDPHVDVPNVVGLDQASATAQLQGLGLEVAVQNASSRSQAPGQVLKVSPGSGETLVRGDTVTLTVSTGPKQVNVAAVVGWDRDDAVSELEDRGFAVTVTSVTVTSSDQVDTVLAQSPGRGPGCRGLDGHDHRRGEGQEVARESI